MSDLNIFTNGSLADASEINENFSYLDSKITDTASRIYTNNASLESQIASVNSSMSASLALMNNILRPIGQPIFRLDDTIFDDEIRLEGDEVSRTTYADLFDIYGTTYGEGDGSTTFNLPDFRGRTIWGGTTFGYIEAGLPNITGTIHSPNGVFSTSSGAFTLSSSDDDWHGTGSTNRYETATLNASLSSEIYGASDTVQPPSIVVRVVTRYE